MFEMVVHGYQTTSCPKKEVGPDIEVLGDDCNGLVSCGFSE